MGGERKSGSDYAVYAPPAPEQHREPRAKKQALGAQDAVAVALTLLLGLQAILHGANGIACLLLASGASGEATSFLVMLSRNVATVSRFPYWVGVVVFIAFLISANKNARAFATADEQVEERAAEAPPAGLSSVRGRARQVFEFTPPSMGWWFFVPFLNLVRPYQAVLAVWFASVPRSGSGDDTRADLVSLWWASWLAYLLASRLGALVGAALPARSNDIVLALVAGLAVVACSFALRLIRTLHARQGMRAAELWPED